MFRTLRFSSAISAESVDTLPTEILLFKCGVNDSTKGPVTFDAQSASLIMAQFAREGVDFMIDVEHDSLYPERRAMRANAGDAAGWGRLEVRNGCLWVVGVRWTPDGCDRLLSKKQRYISPAFQVDEHGRVVSMINAALVAMPATYEATPLVAASKSGPAGALPAVATRSKMDPTKVKAAIDAIVAGDGAAAIAILTDMIASAAGAESTEAPGAEAMGETAETPPPAPGEDTKALSKVIDRLDKFESENKRLSKVVADFEARDRAADDGARAELVGELVKLGVELPATAWADADKRVPAARFASEPVAELRARVEAYRAAGKTNARPHKAPESTVTLSKDEEDAANKITDPVKRARFVQLRQDRAANRRAS